MVGPDATVATTVGSGAGDIDADPDGYKHLQGVVSGW